MTTPNLDHWLAEFVDSAHFRATLEQAILAVESPAQRAKLLLDLVEFVKPKFKTVDPPSANESKEIVIQYVLDQTTAKARK